jgi:uncharacterized protein YndB with AHSA1/START domain
VTRPNQIQVDQFVARPPEAVWRAITEPELLARWWAPGDVAAVVGHRFLLDMAGWGQVPCTVLEAQPPTRFSIDFDERWTITFDLVAEGAGTRLLLTHAGFDLDDPQQRFAFDQMGPGWRDEVLPRLAELVADEARPN